MKTAIGMGCKLILLQTCNINNNQRFMFMLSIACKLVLPQTCNTNNAWQYSINSNFLGANLYYYKLATLIMTTRIIYNSFYRANLYYYKLATLILTGSMLMKVILFSANLYYYKLATLITLGNIPQIQIFSVQTCITTNLQH